MGMIFFVTWKIYRLQERRLSYPFHNVFLHDWQVNEQATSVGSPWGMLSRRCVALLTTAWRPDVWPNAELKLLWFDKLLMTVESHGPNSSNSCTALELLGFLIAILVSGAWYFLLFLDENVNVCCYCREREVILSSFKPLQRGNAAHRMVNYIYRSEIFSFHHHFSIQSK